MNVGKKVCKAILRETKITDNLNKFLKCERKGEK